MTKKRIIQKLHRAMMKQAIDLEWVQEKILVELTKDLDEFERTVIKNCRGPRETEPIDLASPL